MDEASENAAQEGSASTDPEEYLADRFAGFFLMPATTVKHGFRMRVWEPQECTPPQVYTVASWLGVGYGTLVHHMRGSLGMLTYPRSAQLLKVAPKDIRAGILGRDVQENLFVVGEKWTDCAVYHAGNNRADDRRLAHAEAAGPGTYLRSRQITPSNNKNGRRYQIPRRKIGAEYERR